MIKIKRQEELEIVAAALGWGRGEVIEEDNWHSCSLSERRQRLNAMVDNKEKFTPEQVNYILLHHPLLDYEIPYYTAFDLADILMVFNRNPGGVRGYINLDSEGLTVDEFICSFMDLESKVADKDIIVGVTYPCDISVEEGDKVVFALTDNVRKCKNRTSVCSRVYLDSWYIQIFVF